MLEIHGYWSISKATGSELAMAMTKLTVVPSPYPLIGLPSVITSQGRRAWKRFLSNCLVSEQLALKTDIPAWIADTGIGEQRDAVKEKEANQTLKQKTRERVQPKMGKIDIDYQKLHDAFFKYQRKPLLSKFGEA